MKRIALLVLVLLLLCACQPTPEQEIVVYQGDHTLEQRVTETLAPQETPAPVLAYEAPERITETYPLGIGDATVVFDTPVTVPFGDRYTVYEVEKAIPTAEQAKLMLSAFFGDVPFFQKEFQPNKAYYAELIKQCDESDEVKKRNEDMASVGEEYTKQDYIRMEMEHAPLEIEEVPADLESLTLPVSLHAWRAGNSMPYNANFRNEDSHCEFWIGPFDIYIADETLIAQGEYPGAPQGRKLDHLSIERDDAIAVANDFLQRAGLPHMGLSAAECIRAEYTNRLTGEHHSQGWQLVYHHSYNGVTGVNQTYSATSASDLYQSPWPQETVYLYVDSEGVQWVRWFGMSEVVAEVEKTLEIAPFDQVLQTIKNHLRVENAYAEVAHTRTIRVVNIELGYCVIQKVGDATRGYTVPAWIISYQVDNEETDGLWTFYYDFIIDAATCASINTVVIPGA